MFHLPCSVMFNAIDATGIDRGPLLNNQVQVALFFIFFVIIFTFFFLNIFVALIILTFQEQGENEEGECELERNQVLTQFLAFLLLLPVIRHNYRSYFPTISWVLFSALVLYSNPKQFSCNRSNNNVRLNLRMD